MVWQGVPMPCTKLSQGRYRFTLTLNGIRHRKQVNCPSSHVVALYHEWERGLYDGVIGKTKLFDKLDEYLEWSKINKKSAQFRDELAYSLKAREFFGDVFLHDIKRHHILSFAKWRKTHGLKDVLSDSTVKRTTQMLSFFFGWCLERGYIKDTPSFNLKLKESVPRVAMLSPQEIEKILSHAFEHRYTFLLIAMTTGLRHSEILSLRWDEVHLDRRLIVLSGERTKSHRNRQVIMPDVLVKHLGELKLFHGEIETIITYNGKRIKSMKRAWGTLRKKAGFPSLRIHDLRHAYATTLRGAGVSLSDIKELLGHKDLSTTMRYAHFDGYKSTVSIFDKIIKPGQRTVNDEKTQKEEQRQNAI